MSLQDLDASTLQPFVEQSSTTPLLLDLWAPWCAPCRAQAPALHRLAGANEGRLRVAKLNVDDNKELAQGLKVRSIPTLILFKDGKELSRRTGVQSLQKLQQWLTGEGVAVGMTGSPAGDEGDEAPLGGAFYGDTDLREFFCGRLVRAAAQGRLQHSRFPYWTEGRGTISAAFGQSANPELFERLTGMPSGFAVCLEAPGITDVADVERILALLPTGADLRKAPARYMAQWLDDASWNWPDFLGSETDALRVAWLRACRESIEGRTPCKEAWELIKSQAQGLDRRGEPLLSVQTHFAGMLTALTPLPHHDEASQWGNALLLYGTCLVISRARFEAGWRARDFSMEEVVHGWFVANCPNPQEKTSEEMEALQARMREANSELLAEVEPKQEAFMARHDELVTPWRERLTIHLLTAMRTA